MRLNLYKNSKSLSEMEINDDITSQQSLDKKYFEFSNY